MQYDADSLADRLLAGAWSAAAVTARLPDAAAFLAALFHRFPDRAPPRRDLRDWLLAVEAVNADLAAVEELASWADVDAPLTTLGALIDAPPLDLPSDATLADLHAHLTARAVAWPDPSAGSVPLDAPDLPLRTVTAATWSCQRFATPGDLAEWLDITPAQLAGFADLRGFRARTERLRHYRRHRQGDRLIEAPKPRLKRIQRRILDGILSEIPVHSAAHGFVTGRSVMTAAAPHCGRAVVLHLDLRHFFWTVAPRRVVALFEALGQPRAVARDLSGLCTTRTPWAHLRGRPHHERQQLRQPHLAQGAPTSPAIANLVAFALDRRLAALCQRWDAWYTRYADDLLISGGPRLSERPDGLLERVAEIVRDEGWTLHRGKIRIMRRHARQQALGLILNGATPAPPRAAVDRVRAAAHQGEDPSRVAGRLAWTAAGRRGRLRRVRCGD